MKNFKRIIFSFILVTFFFSPLASSLGNSISDQKSPKEAPLNSSCVKFMRSPSKTTYGYIPPTFDKSSRSIWSLQHKLLETSGSRGLIIGFNLEYLLSSKGLVLKFSK